MIVIEDEKATDIRILRRGYDYNSSNKTAQKKCGPSSRVWLKSNEQK